MSERSGRGLLFCQEFLWRRGGHTVAQSVEALRYKPEGRGFHSRWCHRNFSLTWSFRPHYYPGDYSACNRNEYQEYFLGDKGGRCVGLTKIPPSCTDCLEILVPSNCRNPQGLHRDNLTFFFNEFQKHTLYEIYQIKYFSRMWLVTPVPPPVLVRPVSCLMLFVLFLNIFMSSELFVTANYFYLQYFLSHFLWNLRSF